MAHGTLRRDLLSLFIQASLPLALSAPVAQAATCSVTTSADDAAGASATVTPATTSGTLRDCMPLANLLAGADATPGAALTIDLSAVAGGIGGNSLTGDSAGGGIGTNASGPIQELQLTATALPVQLQSFEVQ